MHSPMLSSFINALLCSAPLYSLHQCIHQCSAPSSMHCFAQPHYTPFTTFINALLCSAPLYSLHQCIHQCLAPSSMHCFAQPHYDTPFTNTFTNIHQCSTPSLMHFFAHAHDQQHAACYDFFTRGGAHGISECMGLWPGEEGRGKINSPV